MGLSDHERQKAVEQALLDTNSSSSRRCSGFMAPGDRLESMRAALPGELGEFP